MLSLKPHFPAADNRSAPVSTRALVLLAGGLDWRSLSSRCFAADHISGFSSLPCWLAWCSWALPAAALILPDVSHEPVVHNPFPQLSKVAIAPFFNQSDEPTVDGRKFALAYFAELQAVPGFEVVPLGVVEEAIIDNQVDLSRPGEARRLAKILGVDAVVIGSVTDYTPYYPPRCGLRVEWYAANPGFHEIPPGYGLPWGTPEEEYIPAPLVFESEFALAKAQLATQTPDCDTPPLDRAACCRRNRPNPRRSRRSA